MYWSIELKILMIEDDSTIAFAVKTYLNKLHIETIIYNNLSQTENLNFNDFDVLLLDANLLMVQAFIF